MCIRYTYVYTRTCIHVCVHAYMYVILRLRRPPRLGGQRGGGRRGAGGGQGGQGKGGAKKQAIYRGAGRRGGGGVGNERKNGVNPEYAWACGLGGEAICDMWSRFLRYNNHGKEF